MVSQRGVREAQNDPKGDVGAQNTEHSTQNTERETRWRSALPIPPVACLQEELHAAMLEEGVSPAQVRGGVGCVWGGVGMWCCVGVRLCGGGGGVRGGVGVSPAQVMQGRACTLRACPQVLVGLKACSDPLAQRWVLAVLVPACLPPSASQPSAGQPMGAGPTLPPAATANCLPPSASPVPRASG